MGDDRSRKKYQIGPTRVPFVYDTAKLEPDGRIRARVFGLIPQGEALTPDAAWGVVEHLRTSGEEIGELRHLSEHAGPADAVAETPEGPVAIQVVRPLFPEVLWSRWVEHEGFERLEPPEVFAAELFAAVSSKSGHYSQVSRRTMLLVIDASCSLAQIHPAVIKAYRSAYVVDTKRAGFRQVWVVADPYKWIHRLDEEMPVSGQAV